MIKRVYFDNTVLIDSVYGKLSFLENEYPSFYNWYYGKVVQGIKSGERNIFLYYINEVISGILILKYTSSEKKICTLYVDKEYRGMGIGEELLLFSIKELGTRYPLITVDEKRNSEFSSLFYSLGFKLMDKKKNWYIKGVTEYCYNGILK